jgi:hypothetical protein
MNVFVLSDEKWWTSNVYVFSTKEAAQKKMRWLLDGYLQVVNDDLDNIEEWDGTETKEQLLDKVVDDGIVSMFDDGYMAICEREVDNDGYNTAFFIGQEQGYENFNQQGFNTDCLKDWR